MERSSHSTGDSDLPHEIQGCGNVAPPRHTTKQASTRGQAHTRMHTPSKARDTSRRSAEQILGITTRGSQAHAAVIETRSPLTGGNTSRVASRQRVRPTSASHRKDSVAAMAGSSPVRRPGSAATMATARTDNGAGSRRAVRDAELVLGIAAQEKDMRDGKLGGMSVTSDARAASAVGSAEALPSPAARRIDVSAKDEDRCSTRAQVGDIAGLARKYGVRPRAGTSCGCDGACNCDDQDYDDSRVLGGDDANENILPVEASKCHSGVATFNATRDNDADAEALRKRIAKAEARVRALDEVLEQKEKVERQIVARRTSQTHCESICDGSATEGGSGGASTAAAISSSGSGSSGVVNKDEDFTRTGGGQTFLTAYNLDADEDDNDGSESDVLPDGHDNPYALDEEAASRLREIDSKLEELLRSHDGGSGVAQGSFSDHGSSSAQTSLTTTVSSK